MTINLVSLKFTVFLCIFIIRTTAVDFDSPSEVFAVIGANETLTCQANEQTVWWSKDNQNITKTDKRFAYNTTENGPIEDENEVKAPDRHTFSHTLTLVNVTKDHNGSYLCHFPENEKEKNVSKSIAFTVVTVQLPTIQSPLVDEIKIKEKDGKSFTLSCVIKASPTSMFLTSIKWEKEMIDRVDNKDSSGASEINAVIASKTNVTSTDTHITVSVTLDKATKKHNGTYICSVLQPSFLDKDIGAVEKRTSIIIQSAPSVMLSLVKAIGKDRIFLNWTVPDDGNSPINSFIVQYMADGENNFHYSPEKLNGTRRTMVLKGLQPKTKYKLKISATNAIGTGLTDVTSNFEETLNFDPSFTPIVEVKGNSHSTITIGWQPPTPDLLDYIHYYDVVVFQGDNKTIEEAIHPQNSRNLPYMVVNLKTATEYFFKVRACNEYSNKCGNWSEIVNGTTMDGQSSAPLSVNINCMHHSLSKRNIVTVKWEQPSNPNGIIVQYQLLLEGSAYFRAESGRYINQTFGPKAKTVDKTQGTTAIYDSVPANTNYTLSVAAITRSKKPGDKAVATCTMPPSVPESVPKALLGKHLAENYNWIFKLILPRVSERTARICCYRIYMIRLGKDFKLDKSPDDYDVMTFADVHRVNNSHGGVYMAEILANDDYRPDVLIGSNVYHRYKPQDFGDKCAACMKGITRAIPKQLKEIPTTGDEKEEIIVSDNGGGVGAVESQSESSKRRRRHGRSETEPQNLPSTLNHAKEKDEDVVIFDGPLDINSNYSGFYEVIVEEEEGMENANSLQLFSDVFAPLSPKPPPVPPNPNDRMYIVITYLLSGLIILAISLFILLCLLHRYQKKHILQGNEVVSLTDSLRLLCHGGRGNHHQHRSLNTVSKPPDLPPIQRENLPQAYVDRHKDSDYGFQHEFELLPDRFTDRTSRACDSKENVYKNRYPDIKCYDQTRVKLSSTANGSECDYINANFVIGYKERKKFICAQGPMDSTMNDFWQMIWEQHLEIIIMLTNLEEYNKTKCAKYWPDKVGDSVQFGEINVTYDSDERYSDYLVRNMKVMKRNINGDSEAAEEPSRNITQYHYLVWKDFQAPEHPYGILRFIKTINMDYSVQRGPLLIHCSAGVGRTGTLVALDSLMQQLNEEGQVAIFNTICDMRHQRNYLVQSLKQYIFLYRALLDVAQFGDTELRYKGLSASVEALRQRMSDSKEQTKLEMQFDKIKSIQDDIRKTCAVGSGEENLAKNRSEDVIPYDRNRVILSPIPGRDHSTYINASFIEGYDNHESFIIAQDPLESTIGDFWRMISEQSIPTIVMMSEIGDVNLNKCPRYWADDEIKFDHILVKYIQSESCPYYTKREFAVTNCKINDTINVTHFQYNGWPTVDGEVPEVTRGILEIVHQSQQHHLSKIEEDNTPRPMLVHCCKGTDRSSIFVAMSILVQQLKLEKRVDIRVTTQKLRTQRSRMIDISNAYEFLHRALVDFSNLHKNLFEGSPS